MAMVKLFGGGASGSGAGRRRSALAEAGHDVVATTRDPDSPGGIATPECAGLPSDGAHEPGLRNATTPPGYPPLIMDHHVERAGSPACSAAPRHAPRRRSTRHAPKDGAP